MFSETDAIAAAGGIISIGIRQGRTGIELALGSSVDQAIEEAFAELHKNNLPEESFVFLLRRLFARRLPSDDMPEIDPSDLSASYLLENVKKLEEYQLNAAVTDLTEFQRLSVLEDFIVCLAQALRSRSM